MQRVAALVFAPLLFACTKPEPSVTREPATTAANVAAATAKPVIQIGAPIAAGSPMVQLAEVAKHPGAYKGKTITTTGTVTAVCQNMGCWMEVKDDASEAHIKMAGHSFFVPKTASGHHAKIQAVIVPSDDKNAECNEEAKNQMGHAVAKVQLEATGVELD